MYDLLVVCKSGVGGVWCCKNEARPPVSARLACSSKDHTVHNSSPHHESTGTLTCKWILSLACSIVFVFLCLNSSCVFEQTSFHVTYFDGTGKLTVA